MNISIRIDTESTVEKNPANINGTGKNICIGFNTDATRKKYRWHKWNRKKNICLRINTDTTGKEFRRYNYNRKKICVGRIKTCNWGNTSANTSEAGKNICIGKSMKDVLSQRQLIDAFFFFFFLFLLFLDASSHLYKRVCQSVGRLVRRSVGPSVRHAFVKNAWNREFYVQKWSWRHTKSWKTSK